MMSRLVVIVVMLSPIILSDVAGGRIPATANTDFIRASCYSTTAYPQLCYALLVVHSKTIQHDPKLIAQVALTISRDMAIATSREMTNMTAKEGAPMKDCMEELGDAVDLMWKSMVEMKKPLGPDFWTLMSDVQTWVSAALTNEDTCLDGFDQMGDQATKTIVRGKVLKLAHVTSNALALINKYTDTQDLLNQHQH